MEGMAYRGGGEAKTKVAAVVRIKNRDGKLNLTMG